MNSTEMAKLIAAELISGGPAWLFLLMVGVVAGVGSYAGKYLEIKGQNLATREDFQGLQRQLGESTRTVESIKAEYGNVDWAAREWATLRIKKIEELMGLIRNIESHIEQIPDNRSPGDEPTLTIAASDDAMVISEIYLPELMEAVAEYVKVTSKVIAIYEIAPLGILGKGADDMTSSPEDYWIEVHRQIPYAQWGETRGRLRTLAARLLREVVLARATTIHSHL